MARPEGVGRAGTTRHLRDGTIGHEPMARPEGVGARMNNTGDGLGGASRWRPGSIEVLEAVGACGPAGPYGPGA